MRTQTAILAAMTAFAFSSGAWADGGAVPETPPPPPPPPAETDPAPEAAPAPSHNDFVMVLELGAGWSFIDTGAGIEPVDLDDDSYPLVEGGGRANVPLSANWALQLDVEGLATFTDREDGENNLQTVFSGAAHLNWRQPSHAFGALVQLGSANGGADENANFYNFGAEGLYNWTDFTLLGQAGYFFADDETENDTMDEAWWVRGVGRFYAGPDSRVQLEAAYADGEERNSGGIDVTAISWGGRFDHSVTGGPVAIFLSYEGNYIDNDNPFEPDNYITDHTALVGLRVHFGDAGSLKESDRNGPSFDTPDVGRWTGWTVETVDD